MNRRHLIIVLGTIYYALQVALLVYWHSLASDELRVLELVFTIAVAVGLALIDAIVVRYLLSMLTRFEKDYAEDVSAQLEESLNGYRIEAEREEHLMQNIGAAIEEELARAREALASGSLDEADDHLRAGLDIASQMRGSYCDNAAVAAVLETKARQCADAGVGFAARVTLPEEIPLPEIEVAAIFFNLIDNALHECEALRADGTNPKPEIQVKASIQAGQLFVEVTNPCRSGIDVQRSAHARQTDTAQRHGWGTNVVDAITYDHHGIAELGERDGVFVAQVMIPL